MRNAWLIAKRELGAYFIQPLGYIFAVIALFFGGYFFMLGVANGMQFQGSAPADLGNVFGVFNFLGLFFIPALTMRLLSEERQTGTIEVLMTLPLRDGEVVFGKFLAGTLFYIIVVAFTSIFALILARFGNPDIPVILTGYLGVILFGALMIAAGVFASALGDSQITAWIIGFAIALILFIVDFAVPLFPNLPGWASTFLSELSSQGHYTTMFQGLIEVKDIVYFVGLIAIFLFAATRVMESRRWR